MWAKLATLKSPFCVFEQPFILNIKTNESTNVTNEFIFTLSTSRSAILRNVYLMSLTVFSFLLTTSSLL